MARVSEASVRDEKADLRKLALFVMANMELGEGHDRLWGLDGKRPFGNRDWEVDILEELEVKPDGDDECYSDDQRAYANDLFVKTTTYIAECVQAVVENAERQEAK